MQINPPFGYGEIVPLQRDQKVRLPAPGALPEFCRRVNAVPISYSEFGVACRDYPLAFITTDQGRTFIPVGVLGVTGGENLFLCDGRWDNSGYLPAYLRRHPFCMARVTLNSVEQADRLICVEKAFLSDDGGACSTTRAPPFHAGNRSRSCCRSMKPISSAAARCARSSPTTHCSNLSRFKPRSRKVEP